MKKLTLIISITIIMSIAGLIYLYFGGSRNYVNNNIPAGFQYTKATDIIPLEYEVPSNWTHVGEGLDYNLGPEYDNEYFYQKNSANYCHDNSIPKTLTYYEYRSPGLLIFQKAGGVSFRKVFICDKMYFIIDFADSRGQNIYGPFYLK